MEKWEWHLKSQDVGNRIGLTCDEEIKEALVKSSSDQPQGQDAIRLGLAFLPNKDERQKKSDNDTREVKHERCVRVKILSSGSPVPSPFFPIELACYRI